MAFLCGCQTGSHSEPETVTDSSSGVAYRKDKDLQKVWLADGFDFTGNDALWIAPTVFKATERTNEVEMRSWAVAYLQEAFANSIRTSGVFRLVSTNQADLPPNSKALKLEDTIVEYEKGGGGARYFAGLYGAGQPVIKVHGRMLATDKPVFEFESRRSGDSGMGRAFGGFMSDKDVQQRDINDLAKDLADFVIRTAKHLPPR